MLQFASYSQTGLRIRSITNLHLRPSRYVRYVYPRGGRLRISPPSCAYITSLLTLSYDGEPGASAFGVRDSGFRFFQASRTIEMKLFEWTSWLLAASSTVSAFSIEKRAACNADNCLRAVRSIGTQGTVDCSSFLATSVTSVTCVILSHSSSPPPMSSQLAAEVDASSLIDDHNTSLARPRRQPQHYLQQR